MQTVVQSSILKLDLQTNATFIRLHISSVQKITRFLHWSWIQGWPWIFKVL